MNLRIRKFFQSSIDCLRSLMERWEGCEISSQPPATEELANILFELNQFPESRRLDFKHWLYLGDLTVGKLSKDILMKDAELESILIFPNVADSPQMNGDVVDIIRNQQQLHELRIMNVDVSAVGLAPLLDTPNLWSLEIIFSHVSGSYVSVGQLSELKELMLFKCDFPENEFSAICKCTNLEKMFLGDVPIDDKQFSCLTSLKRLEDLALIRFEFNQSLLKTLYQLSSLRRLNLYDSTIDGQSEFSLNSFTHLESLRLIDCQFVDNDVIRSLPSLAQLLVLEVGKCQSIDDGIMETIIAAPNLKRLVLRDANISAEAVARLSDAAALESLSLDSSQVSEEFICSLPHFSHLKELSVAKQPKQPLPWSKKKIQKRRPDLKLEIE